MNSGHKLLTTRSYNGLLQGLVHLLEDARIASARSVNTIMTATYWEIGHRIIEYEQKGQRRAPYGKALLTRLAADLSGRFGRGFSERNLEKMRLFYLSWRIPPTVSAKSPGALVTSSMAGKSPTVSTRLVRTLAVKTQTTGAASAPFGLPVRFPLPWSHYVRLLSVENPEARAFYEQEALRGGWSVRQLDRQVATLFYDRTLLSRNKATMLKKGSAKASGDALMPEEEIKDPLVLEFLGLKDEYSELALEDALIHHLEHFLLELGNDFAFVARQKRLRVGDEWYRIDLVFFHRRLRCLILIDLKTGKFTHADAGQMNLYLNYAREHWTQPGENPPVGLILSAKRDQAMAHYALGNLRNKVLAGEYRLALPAERQLVEELERTQRLLEAYYRRRRD
jgi:predicted nuclease of restriction endonuclease-like (RecB) superfamily